MPRRITWALAGGVGVVNVALAAVVGPVVAQTSDAPAPAEEEEPAASQSASASYLVDPQLVEEEDRSWAVGSSLDEVTMLPMFELTDGGWQQTGSSLTTSPAWAQPGYFSPSITHAGDQWWLFFTAPSAVTGRHCLGAATASDPGDGFAPLDEPLYCATDRDAVDPSPYLGPDGWVLTWAERVADAETGQETWELHAAGLDLGTPAVGESTVLLSASSSDATGWEGGVVDSPVLADVDGTLVLLYAGNRWGTADYAPGYAVCTSLDQACERRTVDAPLAVPTSEDDTGIEGFGGLQPIIGPEGTAAAFHGWIVDPATLQVTEPVTFRADLSWADDALAVGTPTRLEVSEETP